VQDARARFGDVIDAALKGRPQRVTRRGKDAVVVVSEEEWRRLAGPKPAMNLGEYLATFPLSADEWREIAPKRHPPRKSPVGR
jgi:prevent-host-death family protein